MFLLGFSPQVFISFFDHFFRNCPQSPYLGGITFTLLNGITGLSSLAQIRFSPVPFYQQRLPIFPFLRRFFYPPCLPRGKPRWSRLFEVRFF